jgi:hypothetical protein
MYLEDKFPGGGDEAWCCACRQPIRQGERLVRVAFNNDPTGDRGFTGPYHQACSKPFASLARVINLTPWAGR